MKSLPTFVFRVPCPAPTRLFSSLFGSYFCSYLLAHSLSSQVGEQVNSCFSFIQLLSFFSLQFCCHCYLSSCPSQTLYFKIRYYSQGNWAGLLMQRGLVIFHKEKAHSYLGYWYLKMTAIWKSWAAVRYKETRDLRLMEALCDRPKKTNYNLHMKFLLWIFSQHNKINSFWMNFSYKQLSSWKMMIHIMLILYPINLLNFKFWYLPW